MSMGKRPSPTTRPWSGARSRTPSTPKGETHVQHGALRPSTRPFVGVQDTAKWPVLQAHLPELEECPRPVFSALVGAPALAVESPAGGARGPSFATESTVIRLAVTTEGNRKLEANWEVAQIRLAS